MAPRLSKRQLREQEELAALGLESDHGSDEEEIVAQPKQRLVFEALNDSVADEARGSEAGDAADTADADDEETEFKKATETPKVKPGKRKKKKKGAKSSETACKGRDVAKKGREAQASEPTPMDDIDRALAELGAAPTSATSAAPDMWQRLKTAFAVEQKHLDADAEIRRMFGSHVVGVNAGPTRGHVHARLANNPHHAASFRRAGGLIPAPAGWPAAAGVLRLERCGDAEVECDTDSEQGDAESADAAGEWYAYEHPIEYRLAQLEFMQAIQQGDVEELMALSRRMPYHVDTQLQLSEVAAQQGDLGEAGLHLDVALYALASVLPTGRVTTGVFRLSYQYAENRAFFVGIARKVALLVRRGTWRTACEWAKLGLAVGGSADPVGMLMHLDFLAVKSGQHAWFLSLVDALAACYPGMHVMGYPGVLYASALCRRALGHTDADAALTRAILQFPCVVPLLLAATGGGSVSNAFMADERAVVDSAYDSGRPSVLVSLLAQVYVTRNASLWKEPENLAWLTATVAEIERTRALSDNTRADNVTGLRYWNTGIWDDEYVPIGLVRAVSMTGDAAFLKYLPQSVLSQTSFAYDPMPPRGGGSTHFDARYFEPIYARFPATAGREREALEPRDRLLAQVMDLGRLLIGGGAAPAEGEEAVANLEGEDHETLWNRITTAFQNMGLFNATEGLDPDDWLQEYLVAHQHPNDAEVTDTEDAGNVEDSENDEIAVNHVDAEDRHDAENNENGHAM